MSEWLATISILGPKTEKKMSMVRVLLELDGLPAGLKNRPTKGSR